MTTTTFASPTTEVHYDPDCHPEQLEQVLRALDQWSDRTAQHVNHQRVSDRHPYRSTVTIEIEQHSPLRSAPLRQVFHVPARNVSKSGLGFVAPPVLMPRLVCDESPLLRAEIVFTVGTQVKVRLSATGREMPTLSAEIVRARHVHFGFMEIGVRFLAREELRQTSSNGIASDSW